MTTTDAATPGGKTHASPADDRQRPAPMQIDTAPRRRQRGPVSRFFRSLFSHLLFAGAAVAGVLGYLYHQPILRDVGDTVCAEKVLGQWMTKSPASVAATPAPATAAAAAPRSQAAASSEPQRRVPATVADTAPPPQPATAAPAETTPVAATAPAATAAAPAPSPEPAAKPEVSPATPIPSTGEPAAEAPAVEPAPATPVKDSAAPVSTTAAETKPEPETRAQPAETAALLNEPAAKPSSDSLSPRQRMLEEWVAARKAFAEGKTGAVAAYEDLSRAYPDVPELTGELGNIYFQQGKMKEAAAQYYETAQRLIRRGETGAAACLIDVMQRLDAEKAATLQSETQGAKCPATVN